MPECTCDRDTLADGMATPGCPTHAPVTFESALTLSDCCMLPATRHCRAGVDDVFVCRCGKVTTPVPAS